MEQQQAQYFASPVLPTSRTCEFCERPASESFEIKVGSLYMYACSDHHQQARDALTKKAAERKPKPKQDERLFDPR